MSSSVPSVITFSEPEIDAEQDPVRAVIFWLKRDIVRGVFQPLDRLTVERLADLYNAGHSPVREAIQQLTPTGLVVHEYQKGHHVAPVSLADYLDVLDMYHTLYKIALQRAISRGGSKLGGKGFTGPIPNPEAAWRWLA